MITFLKPNKILPMFFLGLVLFAVTQYTGTQYNCASAEDWPMFRGPQANGTTTEPKTPTTWDANTHVKWKTPLARPGNGSPIVSNGKIFLASSLDKEGKQRALLCYDENNGKLLWTKTVEFDKVMPTHKTNPYGSSTPASNGELVAVWHGSAGLHVYTHEGKFVWSKNLGEFKHIWGYGTSPLIVDDKVIIQTGPGNKVYVACYDLKTGDEIWKHEEKNDGQDPALNNKRFKGAWATPVPFKKDLICSFTTRVAALNLKTGKVQWYCAGTSGPRGELAYSSPLLSDKLCIVSAGYQGPMYAVSLEGNPKDKQQWLWKQEKNPQNIGSGFLHKGYMYRVNAGPNTIDCIDTKNGETVWKDRVEGNAYWSSTSFNGKYLYVTDQQGQTIVFEPTPEKLKIVSVNMLKDTTNSTPALANGKIYVRTSKWLWCIE